jgi:hypothetical protein
MRNFGRLAMLGAAIGVCGLGAAVASCSSSSSDDSSTGTDASYDVNVDEVEITFDAAVGCAPALPAGYSHTWVPPRNMPSACTAAQVQAYWDTCLGTSASTAQCNAFFSANAACVACLDSQSTNATYGTLIDLPNGTSIANVGGCLALIDGDTSNDGCGAKFQAAQFCKIDACESSCPVDSSNAASFTAFSNCEADAGATVCETENAASACEAAAQYARCQFTTYENYVVGIGNIMCASASDGGTPDGGDGG